MCLYGELCKVAKDGYVKPNKCEHGGDCGYVHHHCCAWLDKIDQMRCPYCNGGKIARAEVHFRQSMKSMKAPTTTRRLRKLRKDPVLETETSASPTKPAKKRRRTDKLAAHNASPSGKKVTGSKRL